MRGVALVDAATEATTEASDDTGSGSTTTVDTRTTVDDGSAGTASGLAFNTVVEEDVTSGTVELVTICRFMCRGK